MNFVISKKRTEKGILLIVTDKEIVGKVFEEGKKQLDLSKKFYEGIEKSEKEVKKTFANVYIIHLTGENAVGLGIELGLVNKDKILWIEKIPHAEVLMDGP